MHLSIKDDTSFIMGAFEMTPGSEYQKELEEVKTSLSSHRSGINEEANAAYEAAVRAGRRAASRLGRASGLTSRAAAEEVSGKLTSSRTLVTNELNELTGRQVTGSRSAGVASTTASEVSWPFDDLAGTRNNSPFPDFRAIDRGLPTADETVQDRALPFASTEDEAETLVRNLLRSHGVGSADNSDDAGAHSLSLAKTLHFLNERMQGLNVGSLNERSSGFEEKKPSYLTSLTLSESDCTPPAMPRLLDVPADEGDGDFIEDVSVTVSVLTTSQRDNESDLDAFSRGSGPSMMVEDRAAVSSPPDSARSSKTEDRTNEDSKDTQDRSHEQTSGRSRGGGVVETERRLVRGWLYQDDDD